MNTLHPLIKKSQSGDKDALLSLILQFGPLIKKYANACKYEDAYYDLLIAFIRMIQNINLKNIRNKSDSGFVRYFQQTINHEHVLLSNKMRTIANNHVSLDEIEEETQREIIDEKSNFDNQDFLLSDASTVLTPLELDIIVLHYIDLYTIQEIAFAKGVTRQAINNAKLRAINKLRRFFDK